MVIFLVLFFGISMLTVFTLPNIEPPAAGGSELEVEREVLAVQRAFDAARRQAADTPVSPAATRPESFYEGRYPSGYDGHGGAVVVRIDGEDVTAYTDAPPRPGAIERLGAATHCSVLAGQSVDVGGDVRLRPSCQANSDGELPAGVPAGRLVITGAL